MTQFGADVVRDRLAGGLLGLLIGDALGVLGEALGQGADTRLSAFRTALEAARGTPPSTLPAVGAALAGLLVCAADVLAAIDLEPKAGDDTGPEARRWAQTLVQQLRGMLDELHGLAPWLLRIEPPASSRPFGFHR